MVHSQKLSNLASPKIVQVCLIDAYLLFSKKKKEVRLEIVAPDTRLSLQEEDQVLAGCREDAVFVNGVILPQEIDRLKLKLSKPKQEPVHKSYEYLSRGRKRRKGVSSPKRIVS